MSDLPWRSLRAVSKLVVGRKLDLRVEGMDNLPTSGSAIVAARHFHHFYDGCALLATVPRPLHILVALDWVRNRPGRLAMERACCAAAWPVVFRRDSETAVDETDAARALRRAAAATLDLLAAGRLVLIFPEGYPNIDPGFTRKTDEAAFLPFQPGFVRLAALAARRGLRVPIVPAGFSYRFDQRWQATLRFGEPVIVEHRSQEEAVLGEVESRVRCLSALAYPEQLRPYPGDAAGFGANGRRC
jgi:putative membrane protein